MLISLLWIESGGISIRLLFLIMALIGVFNGDINLYVVNRIFDLAYKRAASHSKSIPRD